jgi:hypothetical protein
MITCVRCGHHPRIHAQDGCTEPGCKCKTTSRIYFRPRIAKLKSKLKDPGNPRRDFGDSDYEEEAA